MSKNILITGSTDGIGKILAIKLAQEGHNLFLHGRNAKKLNATLTELQSLSKTSSISGFLADFSDFQAVNKMIQEIKESLSHLDVLINNAGIFKVSNAITKDGLDIRFAVNYLAPYKLTKGLIPLLEKSDDARVINLSSAAQASVDLVALTGKTTLGAQSAYAQSKLALTAWSFALAKQHNDIAVVAVNPGSLLNTKMAKEAYGKHWSSADKGRDILYKLSVELPSTEINGKYFDNDRGAFSKAHPEAYEQHLHSSLLDKTKDILNSIKQ